MLATEVVERVKAGLFVGVAELRRAVLVLDALARPGERLRESNQQGILDGCGPTERQYEPTQVNDIGVLFATADGTVIRVGRNGHEEPEGSKWTHRQETATATTKPPIGGEVEHV